MKTLSCPKCGPITESCIERREETYPVYGRDTTITANVRICSTCGTDIYDRELDSANLERAYDAYRNLT